MTGQEKRSGNEARDLKVSDDSYNYESNEFTDKNVTAGTTYYYKVRGAMKYGSGYKYTPFSKVLSAKQSINSGGLYMKKIISYILSVVLVMSIVISSSINQAKEKDAVCNTVKTKKLIVYTYSGYEMKEPKNLVKAK